MKRYVGAVDQGTTSTRFMIFDRDGREIARHQVEHDQILPRPGWVEHDPLQISARVNESIAGALNSGGLTAADLAAIGITNQRETTVVWNPKTGRPWYNAIVWQDTRTDRIVSALDEQAAQTIRSRAGLPPATYFSGGKLRWILDNVEGVRAAADRGEAIFGTIDTWVIWNLTGGRDGGVHVTDVTNASRTMLMDLRTRQWDARTAEAVRRSRRGCFPRSARRRIRRSMACPAAAGRWAGRCRSAATSAISRRRPWARCASRQARRRTPTAPATSCCSTPGREIVPSKSGLLTTVCYQMGSDETIYALEGSIAVTGSAVQWLRDQLGIISAASEIEALANSVPDNGGMYFVPAFSGLFAPHWRSDARGAIVGMSRFNTRGHLARATLEAICYQTRDVLDAMVKDSGVQLEVLKVDGGATVNDTLMQLQADILGVPVVRPVVAETTALGAAYAAGLATGVWSGLDDLRQNWKRDRQWEPRWSADQRESGYAGWQKAVSRTLDWVDVGT